MCYYGQQLRKKGGIFINKKIFFLITILSACLFKINVHATNANFYEAEYIDNIYLSKYRYSDNTIYYQKARFFRQTGTNSFAYCIEPFRFFEDYSSYTDTITPSNLTQTQIDRIKQIAYFGYGYDNHSEPKWYAITQYMIWQETANGEGEVYFTDTLNGNRVNYYDNEINEIESLIDNYNKNPVENNEIFNIYKGNTLYIGASKDVLKHYTSSSPDIKLDINIRTKQYTEVGEYNYELIRNEYSYNKPIIFYQSNNSQSLMETGDLGTKTLKFKIIVRDATVTINKIDKDTLEAKSQGEASLDGAIYEIYNWVGAKVGEITIKDGTGTISTGIIGEITIKEKSPGIGYTLDTNTYKITLTENNINQSITLSNKVIEKNVKIIKKYGQDDNFIGEENISFGIYNKNNELVNTITTDSNGEANITLPYGEYTIKQLNTTKGYSSVDPFTIIVDNELEEVIELKDYKIPVPNTKSLISILGLVFRFICILTC